MAEFNLLKSFPKVKRGNVGRVLDDSLREISRQQGFDYYDGDRKYGFGGYRYDGRWRAVAKLAVERFNLTQNSRILVERSDKAFLVHDLKALLPKAEIYGTHPSEYSINHAMEGFGGFCLMSKEREGIDPKLLEEEARQKVNPFLLKAEPIDLPFKDNYFETVISINSICNYPEDLCRKAVREIVRVSKNSGRHCYIHTDSWETQEEKQALEKWVLLGKTLPNKDGWKDIYSQEGYKGDWGFIVFDKENF